MPLGLLRIVGWNVLGIGKRVLGDFFKDLSNTVEWSVFLCQEFGAYRVDTLCMDEGHKAFISPAVPGMRALAIVVNSDFLQYVVDDSFLSKGRACSLRLAWGGWSLVLICALIF